MGIFVSATISSPVPLQREQGLVVPLLVKAAAMISRLFLSIFRSLAMLLKKTSR